MSNPTRKNENKFIPHLSDRVTAEQHNKLSEIAKRNRVSLTWVIQEAIDKLLSGKMPLLQVGKR